MNYINDEQIQPNKNNRDIRGINYNTKNLKISKRKQKFKTDNNAPEIIEFKSQDNLILIKNQNSVQNFETTLKKDKIKTQNQLYDSNKNIINKKIIPNKDHKLSQQSNKSNSSVKINTKVNCKKYFATKTSKIPNNNNNNNEYFSNKTNYKERINSNSNISSSNNYNIISSGHNSIKINGSKMINNVNNNKNNQLTMTKSSIQIKGNIPIYQSQNFYRKQKKIESMEYNIEGKGNNFSRGEYNDDKNIIDNNNNYRFNNKNINEQFTKINYDYDSNNNSNDNSYSYNENDIYNLKENLKSTKNNNYNNYNNTNNSERNKNFNYKTFNTNKSYGNYNNIKNNVMKLKKFESESDKNINFVKNGNEYNNIFFYNSNSNTNDINDNSSNNIEKNNFQCRNNDILNDDLFEYNNEDYGNNFIKKKSSEIENKIKNKFIYKKSGNLSEKKLTKINSSNIKSHIRVNDLSNNDPKIMQKIQNNKSNIEEKNSRNNNNENIILKNKINNEIKKYKNKNNYKYNNCDCIEKNNKDINKNIIIKKMEIKNKINNSFDIIDFKLKIPNNAQLEREEIISINIKEDNLNEKIENIINKYSLDSSYFMPLLSLFENSINILNDINEIKITKKTKLNILRENEDNSSECNNLNYSIILDLIDKKMYKEYIGKLYNIDEINENAKILNMSI